MTGDSAKRNSSALRRQRNGEDQTSFTKLDDVQADVIKLGSRSNERLPGGPAQSSSASRIAAASTVVHRPRLSPTADCVMFMVRTILFEIR
jgi:hypothetical protein